ncbi:hypothetical protein P167DRAFT_335401 [Morchella conica CCBAS932]|uniref:Uncharacterized protein n=1 Tax=Morchella conica CCBAS932 TaxID=1392247 RepID=A0A3N4KH26_9PEZI|nr:hypothetical protein P167DRAFT_335401 [Morchella conica CCBAS932]
MLARHLTDNLSERTLADIILLAGSVSYLGVGYMCARKGWVVRNHRLNTVFYGLS